MSPDKALRQATSPCHGKTTLLSIIGCMARPTSGRIRLSGTIIPESLRDQQTEEPVQDSQGIEVTSLPERFLTEIRRTTFGFIFQQFNLIRGLTAIENIMAPAYPVGEKHSLLRQRAGDLLGFFNLSRKAWRPESLPRMREVFGIRTDSGVIIS